MKYLFDSYVNISDQKLHDKRIKTTQHQYFQNNPVTNVLNFIHTYSAMANYHRNNETNEQLISIGKIIFTKLCIFANAVRKWNKKPTANQTCPNFKTNFTAAQINYKKARPEDTAKSHGDQNHDKVVEVVLHEPEKHQ